MARWFRRQDGFSRLCIFWVQLANYFKVTTDYLLGNDDASNVSRDNSKLSSLQRNLGKLSQTDLEKAEGMLKAVFKDIFNDDEDEDDDI